MEWSQFKEKIYSLLILTSIVVILGGCIESQKQEATPIAQAPGQSKPNVEANSSSPSAKSMTTAPTAAEENKSNITDVKNRKPIALVFNSKSSFRDYVFPNQDTKQIVYKNLADHLSSAGFYILPEGSNDWRNTVYIKYIATASETQYTSGGLDPTLIQGTKIEGDLQFRDYKRHISTYTPMVVSSFHKNPLQMNQDFYNATLDEFSSKFVSLISDLYK